MCQHKDCLFPKPCSQLEADHNEYIDVLKAVRELDGIKKVFIRSGIRYDYMLADKDRSFMKELCMHHVSGVLKVAAQLLVLHGQDQHTGKIHQCADGKDAHVDIAARQKAQIAHRKGGQRQHDRRQGSAAADL